MFISLGQWLTALSGVRGAASEGNGLMGRDGLRPNGEGRSVPQRGGGGEGWWCWNGSRPGTECNESNDRLILAALHLDSRSKRI